MHGHPTTPYRPPPGHSPTELVWSREASVSLGGGRMVSVFQAATYAVLALWPDGQRRVRVLPRGYALEHPDAPDDPDERQRLCDAFAHQAPYVVFESEPVMAGELDPGAVIDGGRCVLRVHETVGRWRPWRGTMTIGVAYVGEPGAGTWRARSRPRLIRKMAMAAAGLAARQGHERITIEVRDGDR